MSICKRQFALKWRPYDPLPVDKVATSNTVVSQPSPSKRTVVLEETYVPPTQPSPPPSVLQPPIPIVADNFGIESMEVTENGRTTKSVLSDKGIVPLASVTKKPKSTTEQRKVQWVDSVTAKVTSKEEVGYAALAQLLMKAAPATEKTIVDESIHQPKHATVEDLIADSIKPHIQVDGAAKNVVVDEDNYWFTGIGDTEDYDFIP